MTKPNYRTKRNGVPILSKPEIDAIAEQYILDFCPKALQEPMEIDVDDFVLNYLGLKQDFQYLSHNRVYLGMIVFNDTDKIPVYVPETKSAEYISAEAVTVIIDNSLLNENQEHRYRYTMGHESGHSIFHADYFRRKNEECSSLHRGNEPLIRCRVVTQNVKTKPITQWDEIDTMEWQANYMSSALLMPKSAVNKVVMNLSGVSFEVKDMVYTWETSSVFNVSEEAALYRLQGLGIVSNKIKLSDITEKALEIG